MAIEKKWNPLGELISLQDRMNNLLKDALSSATLSNDRSGVTWSPPVDFFETDDVFMLIVEVPGLHSGDVDIQMEDNELVLSGKRKMSEKDKKSEYFRRERFQGDFRRIFSLPSEIQTEAISANLTNGVLEVRLPKTTKSTGKKIKVEIK